MRTIYGTILAAAVMASAVVAVGGEDDFLGAKWIGGNPVTLPDYDFGAAAWIAPQSGEAALTKTVVLTEKPETAELVVAAHGWFSVEINGKKRWCGACRDLAPCGDFHDWRYAKFVDAAPAMREGTNTFRIATKAAEGGDAAVLFSVLLPDGTRIATDGSWGGARVLGGPREVPWGREMVFRREVNSPRFRKIFVLPDSVASARLSITGLGYYEATINGARVGRKRLDPIPSNYDKLVYYSTYDVAGMLRKGENVIDVTLGHGWYDVRAVATWNWDMAPWRSPPRMIARLDVVTQSGERKTVVSDETWRQVESPIGFDCIREGEVIGARNKRAVDLERNVVNAVEVPAPKGRLVEETVPPTVEKRTVAVKRIDPVDGWWRIDFGEDIAGFMRMRFSDAVADRTVVFRYDERDGVTVDPVDERDGVAAGASAKPLRRIDCHFGWTASHDVIPGGVFQCDRYVTKGEAGEVYEPRFTYSGFRYVFVKGLGRAPRADECEAVVLQTDFQDIGSFSCSSPVFNGLVRMADRAYKSNFVNGYPTDCPHREKNGWTADAALAGEMAMYCYENTAAYMAWLRQVADSQRGDGWISEIVPTAGWGYHGYLDWDAVMAILPMDIYRYRGDAGALEEMYPTLTNYLEKAAIPFLDNGVFRRVRGDWVSAGTRPDAGIVGTCYFKLMCETAAFTARRLGDSAAAARYASFAAAARIAFNREYYRGNGVYGDSRGRQATQGMALSFGMVPDSERKAVQAELVKAVEAADGHLDFGLHGMKWVPRALSEAGRSDLVFRMFTKETAPSPATWLKRGGTSLWEDWGNGASRNHIMFGEFVCWAYQYLAGIRLKDGATAFSEAVIEPQFIDDLEWVRASVKLPGGELSSAWSRKDGKTELTVHVPDGTRAFVNLPGERERVVGPGTHTFAVSPCVGGMGFVDPLIGTEGTGSQYGGMMPYTGVPFGSFHMVPMTRLNRVGQLSFNSADDTLIGFIMTRQPAIWMGDWGEVRIPIEPAKIEHARYTPYLGQVTAGGRTFEYTATAHAAWLRGNLTNMRLLDGYCSNRDDENLGRALPNFKGWRCVKRVKGGMQIGVSLISLEQARRNLEAEIGGKSFEEIVAETKAEWEKYFGRIEIDASEDVKTIFYTGLYHTLLYPRQIDEPSFAPPAATEASDRKYYSAFDDKIHDGTMYNCYSLWDTYRAEHPWLTLIAPERVDGMMQSLLEMYREGGWLPKWPNPGYTGIMVGAPAEIVLEEAMAKGFSGFDHDLAREAIRKNRTVPQKFDSKRRWRDREEYGEYPETRAGLTSYLKRGYVACDETDESVSRTLDFSFADRNKAYTNLWCASAKSFLPRRSDGAFAAEAGRAYTECSPETAVWCVPHDPEGLAALMGGNSAAIRRLDEFFDTLFWKPERGNKSIHGNEPSHHCAYLYNRFGAPEKTQRRVREILARSYSTDRKGFDGNEDCGQMSAWYIFSALGLYPLDPVGGYYEIGSPIVRGAKLRLGAPYAPATLEIRVKNYAPDRWRVRRATLNGVELKDWRVRHCDLVKGGVLEFDMESHGED